MNATQHIGERHLSLIGHYFGSLNNLDPSECLQKPIFSGFITINNRLILRT